MDRREKVDGEVTVDQINAAMKAAANESYGYNEDQIVSSDIVGMRFGSLFDSTQTMEQQRFRLYLGMTMRTLTQARW